MPHVQVCPSRAALATVNLVLLAMGSFASMTLTWMGTQMSTLPVVGMMSAGSITVRHFPTVVKKTMMLMEWVTLVTMTMTMMVFLTAQTTALR